MSRINSNIYPTKIDSTYNNTTKLPITYKHSYQLTNVVASLTNTDDNIATSLQIRSHSTNPLTVAVVQSYVQYAIHLPPNINAICEGATPVFLSLIFSSIVQSNLSDASGELKGGIRV